MDQAFSRRERPLRPKVDNLRGKATFQSENAKIGTGLKAHLADNSTTFLTEVRLKPSQVKQNNTIQADSTPIGSYQCHFSIETFMY